MLREVLWWLFLVMLVPLAVVAAMAIYWSVQYQTWASGPPLVQTGRMLTPEVRIGETVRAEYDYEIRLDCARTLELWILPADGNASMIWSHDGLSTGAGTGMRHRLVEVPLPASAVPGDAVLRSKGSFRCNPVFPWIFAHDLTFRIVP